ncbi:hypothetical protein FHX74_001264 [Friedmanniella endophytica]|uniref:Uncharacterized protein n=1 Tax=Microlunatus kandeliicorticis TaxID=1759536 RepID=A0A7W3IR24_9ACTN|nr:hypothetical protein [Microlunatus kandeliicorticis]
MTPGSARASDASVRAPAASGAVAPLRIRVARLAPALALTVA